MKGLYLAAAVAAFAAPLAAQAPAAQAPVVDTGMIAPDFSAPGATQNGLLPAVKLSAYKGKTVVLAFFYKARTKG
jgi:3-deoxy-D-arabino-heptulosonate 7-phosphate (DAHP) synthase class II